MAHTTIVTSTIVLVVFVALIHQASCDCICTNTYITNDPYAGNGPARSFNPSTIAPYCYYPSKNSPTGTSVIPSRSDCSSYTDPSYGGSTCCTCCCFDYTSAVGACPPVTGGD
jgi:hypothetical protein